MKKNALFSLFVIMGLTVMTGCSEAVRTSDGDTNQQFLRAEGDSTVYGITAEGTTDSILVYLALPYNGADPDTVSILETRRNRQIFGRPNTGDQVAILRSSVDSTKAERIIMIEDLLGKWYYEVYPTLRRTSLNDSLLPQRLKDMLQEPHEYNLTLKNDYTAYNLAPRSQTDDEQTPIVYPKARRFTQWQIYNGHLVFTETKRDSLDNRLPVATDTVDIVRLRRDTLILLFPDGEHTYYRKSEE